MNLATNFMYQKMEKLLNLVALIYLMLASYRVSLWDLSATTNVITPKPTIAALADTALKYVNVVATPVMLIVVIIPYEVFILTNDWYYQ